MKDIARAMNDKFLAGEPVVLAMVLSGQGSAPRKPGAKMICFQNGTIFGTIGGGALESAVQKEAAKLWITKGAVTRSFTLQKDGVEGLEMVCGGSLRILLSWFAPSPANLQSVQRLANLEQSPSSIYTLIRLKGNGQTFKKAELGLFDRQKGSQEITLDETIVKLLQDGMAGEESYYFESLGDSCYFLERMHVQKSLYVFGAGHVARPVVEVASLVGFRTVVLDDREKFANRDNFPKADEIIVLEDFSQPLNHLPLSTDAYVVIVTRGHEHDQIVLEQVLSTPVAYIGMIGSKSKVAHCFQSMREKGYRKDQLAQVHAPIGLDIGSETPEEIGVSIVAQLVGIRSKLKREAVCPG